MPIADVMDTWTKQMGYPVLDLSVSDTDARLSQKRFLLDPKADTSQPPSDLGYEKEKNYHDSDHLLDACCHGPWVIDPAFVFYHFFVLCGI